MGMNSTEIVEYIQNNVSTLASPVINIASSLMAAVFLRKKISTETSTQEFEKIKAGHLKEAADVLLESGEMTYTEYYKMNNFLEIAEKADKLHEKMPAKAISKPYDFDWFMRFYEDAGAISDDTVQELWAKILAGEVQQPGSYSLRTLETLRNLSKAEALLFQKVCSHSITLGNNVFLPHYDDYMKFVDVSFDDVLKVSDCGLINDGNFLVLRVPLLDNEKRIICQNKQFVITAQATLENKNNILEIKQFPFTAIGKELSRLMNISVSDKDILQLGKSLKNENEKRFQFSVNCIISIQGNGIIYQNHNLLGNI